MLHKDEVIPGSATHTWRVQREIGKGTCCKVYEVENIQTKKKAALKVYKEGIAFSAAHDREALLLDLVTRANGPSIYLVDTIDDIDYKEHSCLLQELLEDDLRQLLVKNSGHGLSLYLIQRLGRDFLRGLFHLHKSGFVHGDLKPTNLMWSPQHGCLKIIDYSLSFHVQDSTIGTLQSPGYRSPDVELWNRVYERHDSTENISHSGTATGKCDSRDNSSSSTNTANHSSSQPSATSGGRDFGCDITASPKPNRAADMWSVGCILAELLAGTKLLNAERQKASERCAEKVSGYVEDAFQQAASTHTEGAQKVQLEHLKSLVNRLLVGDPVQRLKSELCLVHPFFTTMIPEGTFGDLLLLPTPFLRMLNVVEDSDLSSDSATDELKEDLLAECQKFGGVTALVIPTAAPGRGKVFVEFMMAESATAALTGLSRRTYNGHSVILTYFPVQDFRENTWY